MEETRFHHETPEEIAQRDCGISVLGEFPNSAGGDPQSSAVTWKLIMFWTGGCSR